MTIVDDTKVVDDKSTEVSEEKKVVRKEKPTEKKKNGKDRSSEKKKEKKDKSSAENKEKRKVKKDKVGKKEKRSSKDKSKVEKKDKSKVEKKKKSSSDKTKAKKDKSKIEKKSKSSSDKKKVKKDKSKKDKRDKKKEKRDRTKEVADSEVEEDNQEVPAETVASPASPGRDYTVSVAVPASIIANAQSPELRAYLVGQIARALTIFGIDEVVVYEDQSSLPKVDDGSGVSQALAFFVRNLSYLECPQYLRRNLFTLHKDLKFAGLQNPLDAPHHMRMDDWSPYREGMVTSNDKDGGSWVACGIQHDIWIDQTIEKGVRCTVKVDRESWDSGEGVVGTAVSPSEPRTKEGLTFGYRVRPAGSLKEALETSCFGEKYDLVIGTSERGDVVDHTYKLPKFKSLLVVLGGLGGLEEVLEDDICQMAERDPAKLFKTYINACVKQSSRTIRTEEALLVTFSLLRPIIMRNVPPS